MEIKARMTFQPVTDLLVFVRRIVVHDKMNAELLSDFGVEFLQEFKPLIVPMAVAPLGL